jgi:hypothetical protein
LLGAFDGCFRGGFYGGALFRFDGDALASVGGGFERG